MNEINLLCLTSRPLELEPLFKGLSPEKTDKEPMEVTAHQVSDIQAAEDRLFENSYSLLLVDDAIEGALAFIRALKNDEMFKVLPVLVLSETENQEGQQRIFQAGADNFVRKPFLLNELLHYMKPLIMNKLMMDDLLDKIMQLQEENIKNYILTDLVKRYIPKTVWDTANRFADEQTILIPETEEEVSIVYGDIAGFTKISQHLNPKEVIDMLNDAYSIVNSLTYRHGGDVDKFIGDAFLAVYSDAAEALSGGVKIQEELLSLNMRRVIEGKTTFLFRIGIHTGRVIRGNVGSELRSDNTLIGDTVNTAARIESVTPAGEVLASRETCLKAGMTVPEKYMLEEKVKGKDEPLVLYNVFRFFRERGEP